MSVKGGIMVPHPPLIIPEVGRGREKEIQTTIDAYHSAARKLASWQPDTVVILSPHSVMYMDYFHISPGTEAEGDFGQFGAPQVKIKVSYDTELVELLSREAQDRKIPAGTLGERDRQLDHGTMIPLCFLNYYYTDYKVVRIGLSGLAFSSHYILGQCIQKAAGLCGRKIAVIGSGDLSHKLKAEGPYGFQREGPEYDQRIMDVMGRGDFGQLFDFTEEFCEKAAECGHRSFVVMAGALDGLEVKAEELSHEGTFGVGYGVCTFEVKGIAPQREFLKKYEKKIKKQAKEKRDKEDAYVRLARKTIETYVQTGEKISLPPVKRYGVIVSRGYKRGLLLPNLEGWTHGRRKERNQGHMSGMYAPLPSCPRTVWTLQSKEKQRGKDYQYKLWKDYRAYAGSY